MYNWDAYGLMDAHGPNGLLRRIWAKWTTETYMGQMDYWDAYGLMDVYGPNGLLRRARVNGRSGPNGHSGPNGLLRHVWVNWLLWRLWAKRSLLYTTIHSPPMAQIHSNVSKCPFAAAPSATCPLTAISPNPLQRPPMPYKSTLESR